MKKLWEGVRNSGRLHSPCSPRSEGRGTGMVRKERPEPDMSSTRLSCPGGFRPVHFRRTWVGSPERQRKALWCHLARVLKPSGLETLKETCPAPLIGLSLVWLNSVTGTLEKPARKSKLLTPVTLRVWRPLQLTLTINAIVLFYEIAIIFS